MIAALFTGASTSALADSGPSLKGLAANAGSLKPITPPYQTFGPCSAQNITINVQTLDAKSFLDNSKLIADAVAQALQQGSAPRLERALIDSGHSALPGNL